MTPRLQQCAQRLFDLYLRDAPRAAVIHDAAFGELAQAIGLLGPFESFLINDSAQTETAVQYSLDEAFPTLVLVEPNSYVKMTLYKWLDFSLGAPHIANLNAPSAICVFPLESTYRIFSSDAEADARAKGQLLSDLEANSAYSVTTENGTSLRFISRHWIDDGYEVLTAPIESSVEGVIAVDGALFFQRIDSTLEFIIEAGKIVDIKPRDGRGHELVEQYKRMTASDFRDPVNIQLAEVGIGCNTGAIISDCFMEAEMVYGTCHFCFGNNACYGGDNPSDFHGASVLIKSPVFTRL